MRPTNGRQITPLALTCILLAAAMPTRLRAQPPAPTVAPAAAAPAASSTAEIDKKILDDARDRSPIRANLQHLCDVIGPRLTGSGAMKRANDWAAERMRAYGLERVRLEPYTIPVGWERGTATARVVRPDNGMALAAAAMAWTPGTAGKVTGDVVVFTARTEGDLAGFRGKLKNAVVLMGAPAEVRPVTAPAAGKNAYASLLSEPQTAPAGPPMSYQQYAAFRRKVSEFLRAEGVAVVLRDSRKPHQLLNMTGSWPSRPGAPLPLPTLFVAHEHYALLHRLATRAGGATTRVEVEIKNRMIPGPITVYNTVGEIRGTQKPDEFVVAGAHLDSWDLAQGATDNATGSCVVLEAARLLVRSGVRPRRTIRFVLFSGEEQGLHGSRAYVETHKDEMPRTSLCVVHDTGTGRVTGVGVQGRERILPLLRAELASLKDVGFTDVHKGRMGGTDHVSFEAAGVPGFALDQAPAEYRLTHHSNADTLDKVNVADLIQGAQVMAVMALRVAQLPDLLPRDRPGATNAGPTPSTGSRIDEDDPEHDQ